MQHVWDTGAALAARIGPLLPTEAGVRRVTLPDGRAGWTSHARLASAGAPHPAVVCAALIKEAEIGGLAGDLREWTTWRPRIDLELVAYRTALPWPWRERSFRVVERYGRTSEGVWILGEDIGGLDGVAEAILAWRPPSPLGRVHLSGYHIAASGDDVVLRRVIAVELDLGLPGWMESALIGSAVRGDVARLQAGLRAPPPALTARIDADPLYAAWR